MPNYSRTIIYSLILFFTYCTKKPKEAPQGIEIPKKTYELDGVWGLNSYMDSIITYKSVAKYRMQVPAWFGILLAFKEDSVTAYGSLGGEKAKLNYSSDTLTKLKKHGDWYLIYQKPNIWVIAGQKQQDTAKYYYRRRDDLSFMTKNSDGRLIRTPITLYFNQKLIAGTYQNLSNSSKIEFKTNGEVEGLGNFKNYQIRDYFGTFHSFENLDVLFLEGDSLTNCWNWKFNQNTLELTKFELNDNQTHYHLSNQKIYLKKLD